MNEEIWIYQNILQDVQKVAVHQPSNQQRYLSACGILPHPPAVTGVAD